MLMVNHLIGFGVSPGDSTRYLVSTDWTHDTGSFSWSGSNVTASAGDKNIVTTSALGIGDFDAIIEVTGGSQSGTTFGACTAQGSAGQTDPVGSDPLVLARGTYGYREASGGVFAKSSGFMVGHKITLKRRSGVFAWHIDDVLDYTHSGAGNTASNVYLYFGTTGSNFNWTANNVRYLQM